MMMKMSNKSPSSFILLPLTWKPSALPCHPDMLNDVPLLYSAGDEGTHGI